MCVCWERKDRSGQLPTVIRDKLQKNFILSFAHTWGRRCENHYSLRSDASNQGAQCWSGLVTETCWSQVEKQWNPDHSCKHKKHAAATLDLSFLCYMKWHERCCSNYDGKRCVFWFELSEGFHLNKEFKEKMSKWQNVLMDLLRLKGAVYNIYSL